MQVGNILFIFGLVNAYIPSMMYMPVDYQDDIMGDMVIVYYSVTAGNLPVYSISFMNIQKRGWNDQPGNSLRGMIKRNNQKNFNRISRSGFELVPHLTQDESF